MKILVAGATGATGSLLVEKLLSAGHQVISVVRSPQKLSGLAEKYVGLETVASPILDLDDKHLEELVSQCDAAASCLGHNLSFKGIYGKPRKLVRDAVMRICSSVRKEERTRPLKFALMNTTGNKNRDLDEKQSFREILVTGLLRLLLPPHADNEQAADVLRTEFSGADGDIEWVAVRPDNLIDEKVVSDYELYPSPQRSPIFDSGQTSRINVADFMARLLTEDELWQQWKGRMPVIYNAAPREKD